MDNQPISIEELLKLAKMSATPIDFEDLNTKEILERKGNWYVIKDMDKLPEHAKRKIKRIKSPNLVQFSNHKKIL
ncbi:hypothetical protein [Candidatus Leptofilum sp.]|uniref:hypothetical protein n=1 Tax=Candidatus Leptofilum sp. TaxID=3241576 RepID=UPI003B59897B